MIAAEIIIFGCLIAGILIAIRVIAGPRNVMKSAKTTAAPRVILLFKDGHLCDMTAEARSLLGDELTRLTSLDELLSDTFPNLSLSDLDRQSCEVFGLHAGSHLTAQVVGNRLRVEIVGLGQIIADRQKKSLGLLTQIERYAPQIIWQQNDQGRIIWSNASYQKLVDEVGADGPIIFPDLVATSDEAPQRRQPSGTKERWFDITMRDENGLLTCFGVETTELVRADENRREYVKTLGRTFADLSTGLAIFDKDRQLKMFNPALLEMSKLPFTFLSTQPRIDTFFDRMRELQMTPVPKDYASWREQFLAVESDAKQGNYCENWPLPDGQTFRVTGRPHPDGAFALLFEDITAEISLTRRFRTEIETGQAVLDSLPDALAVFSQAGTLLMTNSAYAKLWGREDHLFAHRDIGTEMACWSENAVTSQVWSDIQASTRLDGDRKAWSGDALLLDGRPLRCHATPLDGGMTLIRFASTPVVRPVVQKLMSSDPAIRARGR